MISGKTIFISPLDWGLGHATRCVPIIRELSRSNKVLIGVTSKNSFIFETYFPDLQKIELPSYAISYSKKIPLVLKLLLQWPGIRAVIKQEKEVLKELIPQHNIDVVISDNRFGLVNKNVKCIFITHQLHLKAPALLSSLANRVNRAYIHQFNEVWVPDYEDEKIRLSSELSDSRKIRIPVKYIGPQSALTNDKPVITTETYDYLVLLSGVEPQRTQLETLLLEKLQSFDKKIVVVRGTNTKLHAPNNKIKLIDLISGNELKELLVSSKTIICRSGYSTLMDLHLLHHGKCILIPTPGQTEQEYLGDYWKKRFGTACVLQKDLIKTDLEKLML